MKVKAALSSPISSFPGTSITISGSPDAPSLPPSLPSFLLRQTVTPTLALSSCAKILPSLSLVGLRCKPLYRGTPFAGCQVGFGRRLRLFAAGSVPFPLFSVFRQGRGFSTRSFSRGIGIRKSRCDAALWHGTVSGLCRSQFLEKDEEPGARSSLHLLC